MSFLHGGDAEYYRPWQWFDTPESSELRASRYLLAKINTKMVRRRML